MRILLFGKSGQVGSELQPLLATRGDLIAVGRAEVDLSDPAAAERLIAAEKPQWVINAAAYTAVDKAEAEPELAQLLNADVPGVMARAARAVNAPFIHYSTDYVFDGGAQTPYKEDDATNPLGVYGHSKLAGEAAVCAAGGAHLILRTAWVYSLQGHNFLKTMLRLARERDEVRVVNDQIGSPTFAGAIAQGTVAVIDRVQQARGLLDRNTGIYQMTCGGSTSWWGFAVRILALAGFDHVNVVPITTAEYPTPAARPAYSVLSNEKLASVFDVRLPDWEQALETCLTRGGLVG